jgi:aryl sulfotransferase
MQQIIAQLLFEGNPDLDVSSMSPWLDMRLSQPEKLALLASQTHRRFLKTHLPLDALAFSPKAKYLYIGRDARDVVWSFYHHHLHHTQAFYDALNETPGRVGPRYERPAADVRQYWRDFLDRDGHPHWPFWEHVRSWWAARDISNVRLVHFDNLKRDLPSEIRSLAEFLEISVDEANWDAVVEHCTFDWMKAHANQVAPGAGRSWEGGATTFFHRGENRRWTDTLTGAEIAEYENRARQELGEESAHWLATGELPATS